MNFIPGGMEDDDLEEMPDFLLEQIGHGLNVNDIHHLFDDLDLMGFEMEDDDMFDDDFDDDEDYDDFFDSDFDYEDSDEERRKYVTGIFKTLEDSAQVLTSKLSFHRECSRTWAGPRLPRTLPGQTETYECLHRLLEEIELLLKVWKKRVNHPFTAHLERKTSTAEQNDDQDSSGPRLGNDYTESDVESDTPDIGLSFRSPKSNVNMSLTRKKYCQSTKVYYSIFNSEFEFEALQCQIKTMRKHIHLVAFQLFLQNVPSEKLPNELWEKIWKQTLAQPESDFPPTHSSGVREKASRKWTLFENERITEFFGAAGNLHMILFEILFKHHYIMIPPHLVELGTGGNLIQMKYMRFYFFKFVKMLTKKFARLEVLDNGQFKLEPSMKCEDVHMAKNLEKGIYHISTMDLSKNFQINKALSALYVIFSKEPCAYSALVYDVNGKVTIAIWDVLKNEHVATINTSCPTMALHIEKGSNAGVGAERFSINNTNFSMLIDEETVDFGAILYTWDWNVSTTEPKVLIIDSMVSKGDMKDTVPHFSKSLYNIQDKHFVNFRIMDQWTEVHNKTLMVGKDEKGEFRVLTRFSMPKPVEDNACSQSSRIRDIKGNQFLLDYFKYDTSEHNRIYLFDASKNETVETFKMNDLCEMTAQLNCKSDDDAAKEDNDKHPIGYDCRFDLFKDQFILVKDFVSGYLIYDNSGDKPKLLTKGSMSFCNLSLTNTTHGSKLLFMNGLLLGTSRLESEMLPIAPNSLVGHHEDHEVVEVVAIDLENKNCHSLATFGPSAEVNSKFLLNETHRSIFLKKSQTRCHLHAIHENMIAIASDQSSYITLNFGLHPNEIAELEAEPLYQKQMEKEEVLKAKEAAKAQKSKVAKKYLEDPSLTVQGSINLWKGSYGFMRGNGEAKALGNIFVHKTNITPQHVWIKAGMKVEGRLAKDENHTNFMVVDVKILPNPNEASNSHHHYHRGYRGRRSRGGRFNGGGRGRGRVWN